MSFNFLKEYYHHIERNNENKIKILMRALKLQFNVSCVSLGILYEELKPIKLFGAVLCLFGLKRNAMPKENSSVWTIKTVSVTGWKLSFFCLISWMVKIDFEKMYKLAFHVLFVCVSQQFPFQMLLLLKLTNVFPLSYSRLIFGKSWYHCIQTMIHLKARI